MDIAVAKMAVAMASLLKIGLLPNSEADDRTQICRPAGPIIPFVSEKPKGATARS
jgi:hypothetical protein